MSSGVWGVFRGSPASFVQSRNFEETCALFGYFWVNLPDFQHFWVEFGHFWANFEHFLTTFISRFGKQIRFPVGLELFPGLPATNDHFELDHFFGWGLIVNRFVWGLIVNRFKAISVHVN